MKKTTIILFFLSSLTIFSQTALYNEGNLQLHSGAEVGFHTNLMNEGTIENNLGFAGFYSDSELRIISGTNRPVFYDVEIATVNNLELQTSLGVTNDLTFLEGKVITPRNNVNISLDFIRHDTYVGEGNRQHVDGYASVRNYNDQFSFPIGDDNRLRPMILPSQTGNKFFKGAYFFEDPNTPSTFLSFNTDDRQTSINSVSNLEFWDLDGATKTNITLTWDNQSNIPSLTQEINNLRVVGWNKATNEWENLGNTFTEGNLIEGKITSIEFIPDTYEVITIGSIDTTGEATNFNYLVSPNDDNVNDSFVIDEIVGYTYNKLSIYNRWGILVYRKENYKNEFVGQSEGRSTILEKEGLPTGTYYYFVEFGNTKELEKNQKGWVYIQR